MKRVVKLLAMVLLLGSTCFSCRTREIEHPYIKILNSSSVSVICQMLDWIIITEADSLYQCHEMSLFPIQVDSFAQIFCRDRIHGWVPYLNIPFIQFIYMDEEQFEYYYHIDESRCDSVRKNVPILQRYRLKLEDLQKLDWTVPYPPTEAMKDMDIYPPYKDIEDY